MTMNPNQSEVSKERLFDEFNTVIAETEQLLKSIASAGNGKVGELKANVEQRLAAAGDRLAKIREEAMAQASTVARETDQYVQENPWRSIGIVAAASAIAGLAVGLLIARR
jgi:ElaB/YqjD/DUF883 family membrane-anchored ribosome-binding protein